MTARPPRWTWLAASVGALLLFAALALIPQAMAQTHDRPDSPGVPAPVDPQPVVPERSVPDVPVVVEPPAEPQPVVTPEPEPAEPVAVPTAVPAGIVAEYVTDPNYIGQRFYGTHLCVEDRTRTSTLQGAVRSAAADFDNTVLRVYYKRGKGSCVGYATPYDQRIIVIDGYYGRNGKNGWVRNFVGHGGRNCDPAQGVYVECRKWGQSIRGNATYISYRYVVVVLNRSYPNGSFGWDHLATHEIGHAVGLRHRSDTCSSVMPQKSSGCNWISYLSSADKRAVNAIYGQ